MDSTVTSSAFEPFILKDYEKFFQYQQKSNWCWIATAVSIANYYQRDRSVPYRYTQCGLYGDIIYGAGNPIACNPPPQGDPKLNLTGDPRKSMEHCYIYSQTLPYQGLSSIEIIRQEIIDKCRPVVVGFDMTRKLNQESFGKHVIVVYGYQDTTSNGASFDDYLYIADSALKKPQRQSVGDLFVEGSVQLTEIFLSTDANLG